MATCDPSGGECNCSCDTITPDQSAEDYLGTIFSMALDEKVSPHDLQQPKYRDLWTTFLSSEGKGTVSEAGHFMLPKKTPFGSVNVEIGLPVWVVQTVKKVPE